MAIVKTDFYAQDLNMFAPKHLRGELASWSMNAQTVEVEIDASQETPIYAGDKVAIVATSKGKLKVKAAAEGDKGYGFVLYNPKKVEWKAGDIVTVLRDGGVILAVTEKAIAAGEEVYYDPTDGSVTNVANGEVIGIAMEAVSATTGGVLIAVEIMKAPLA
jgi:hypothetical protein